MQMQFSSSSVESSLAFCSLFLSEPLDFIRALLLALFYLLDENKDFLTDTFILPRFLAHLFSFFFLDSSHSFLRASLIGVSVKIAVFLLFFPFLLSFLGSAFSKGSSCSGVGKHDRPDVLGL